jgi:hypothetical protein
MIGFEPRRDEATTARPLTYLRRLEKGAQAYPGLDTFSRAGSA